MLDYHAGFMYDENNGRQMYNAFLKQRNRQEYDVLRDTLGFQVVVTQKLIPFMSERTWDNKSMCYNMCFYNMQRLYSASKILGSEDFSTLYAILRIVFESFPKLFYCIADKEDAMHVFCCEKFFYGKDVIRKPDKDVESYCKSVKDPIDGEHCKYVKNPKWFRDEVYDGREHDFKKIYAIYSVGSHPNIETLGAKTHDDLKYGWGVSLSDITRYSLLNLFIMVNVVAEELKICSEFDDAKWFVKDRMEVVWDSAWKRILLLYPNKDKYSKGLPFALPIGL